MSSALKVEVAGNEQACRSAGSNFWIAGLRMATSLSWCDADPDFDGLQWDWPSQRMRGLPNAQQQLRIERFWLHKPNGGLGLWMAACYDCLGLALSWCRYDCRLQPVDLTASGARRVGWTGAAVDH